MGIAVGIVVELFYFTLFWVGKVLVTQCRIPTKLINHQAHVTYNT